MKLTEQQIARLKALETARGELLPSAVVTDAKQKGSPLHSLFVWDKTKAAEMHWLDRAREIIGSVTVLVQRTEHTIKTPHYVRDPDATGEGYRNVDALRADPVSARQSLIYTLEVASGHLRRAFDLAEPLGLSGEIDELLAKVVGVQRQIKEAA